MGSQMIQIIILAAIALFLILRLRSVLGTREGFEKPQESSTPLPPRRSERPFEVIDGGTTETNATNNDLHFRNSILAGISTTPLAVASGSTCDITTWFNTAGWNNTILANISCHNRTNANAWWLRMIGVIT